MPLVVGRRKLSKTTHAVNDVGIEDANCPPYVNRPSHLGIHKQTNACWIPWPGITVCPRWDGGEVRGQTTPAQDWRQGKVGTGLAGWRSKHYQTEWI